MFWSLDECRFCRKLAELFVRDDPANRDAAHALQSRQCAQPPVLVRRQTLATGGQDRALFARPIARRLPLGAAVRRRRRGGRRHAALQTGGRGVLGIVSGLFRATADVSAPTTCCRTKAVFREVIPALVAPRPRSGVPRGGARAELHLHRGARPGWPSSSTSGAGTCSLHLCTRRCSSCRPTAPSSSRGCSRESGPRAGPRAPRRWRSSRAYEARRPTTELPRKPPGGRALNSQSRRLRVSALAGRPAGIDRSTARSSSTARRFGTRPASGVRRLQPSPATPS